MYVHIGKDIVIDDKSIITILDINSLEKKENLENICKNLGISDNIIDVSENKKKSLIITEKDKKLKGYISNISSVTLAKRTIKNA